jgi:hypothetical protein
MGLDSLRVLGALGEVQLGLGTSHEVAAIFIRHRNSPNAGRCAAPDPRGVNESMPQLMRLVACTDHQLACMNSGESRRGLLWDSDARRPGRESCRRDQGERASAEAAVPIQSAPHPCRCRRLAGTSVSFFYSPELNRSGIVRLGQCQSTTLKRPSGGCSPLPCPRSVAERRHASGERFNEEEGHGRGYSANPSA